MRVTAGLDFIWNYNESQLALEDFELLFEKIGDLNLNAASPLNIIILCSGNKESRWPTIAH